jgi:hypothetical protein
MSAVGSRAARIVATMAIIPAAPKVQPDPAGRSMDCGGSTPLSVGPA